MSSIMAELLQVEASTSLEFRQFVEANEMKVPIFPFSVQNSSVFENLGKLVISICNYCFVLPSSELFR